jgi:hypothetical protein
MPGQDKSAKPGTVIRTPGSGLGRPEEVHTSIGTTQTAGGLAAGDPSGGPHRTPERRAFDKAREQETPVKSGHDPDLVEDPVRTPEDVDATPPHGDALDQTRDER